MDRIPMTRPGYERLEAELKHLKTIERPAVIRSIAEARDHGDLSENAEYHAAREQQSFTEGRIGQLEALLSNAEVIDVAQLKPGDRVVFGATVELEDEDTGTTVTYQIVGDLEADIKRQMIAVSSPIARALIGHSAGDSIEFTAPNGVKHYEVISVRYV